MPRHHPWCVLLIIAGVLLPAAAATLQDTDEPVQQQLPPEMRKPPAGEPPLHQLDFPYSTRIGGAVFAPDGSVLYVQLFPEVINVWEVLVHLWPELLGGLAAVVALVALLLAVRVLRRPQRRGEPHCRRCNYNLSGLPPIDPGAAEPRRRCPECGTDPEQRRPRIGRATRRRLAPVLAPTLIVVLVYSVMLAAGVPRRGRASVWFIWPSIWATEQAEKHQIAWLSRFAARHERIVAIDPATGEVLRAVASRPTPTRYPISLSPDGEWLLLSGGPATLERVSARNGSVRAGVAVPGQDSYNRFGGRDIIGYARDGRSAYVVHPDAATAKTRVLEWDLATDELRPLFETDAYAVTQGRRRVEARRVVLIPGETPMFAVAPSFKEAYDTKSYTIWMHDGASGGLVREIRVAGDFLSTSSPVVSPDGARLFVSGSLDGIFGFDLTTGESLGAVRSDNLRDSGHEELLLSPDGTLLFFPVFPETVLVRSLPERRWIARLSTAGLIGPTLAASPDGRWLSLVGFKGGAPAGGPYLHELLIYDLSSLPSAPPPSQPEDLSGDAAASAP